MPVQPDLRMLKAEARELMKTAQAPVLQVTLFFLAVDLLLSEISRAISYCLNGSIGVASFSFSFAGIFVSLFSTVLVAGYACYCLGVHRGRKMPCSTLFGAFPFAGRVILLTLLQGVLIGAGLLLFVFPGLILSLCYALSLFILCEDPSAGVIEALRRSRIAMRGRKSSLLVLILSFLPLLLLFALPASLCQYFLRGVFPNTLAGALLDTLVSGLVAGCASIYVTPYMALAQVGFYRFVTETDAKPPQTDEQNDP